MLSLAGVPGIYIHSLLGSQNWQEGVEQTGANRTINREKLDFDALQEELADGASLRSLVFSGVSSSSSGARRAGSISPRSPQRVVDCDDRLFVLLRGPYLEASPGEGETPAAPQTVLALHNLSAEIVEFRDRRDRYPWETTG
jgi:hypothetical protein